MTAISATPTFPPIGSATFNADAYAWAVHMAGTFTTEVNAAVSAMAALAAGGAVSLQYTFSTTTTDADPGAGYLRLDAATQNTATTIRADLLGNDTSDYSGILALLDDSTSATKGYITLRHSTTATKWLVFAVASLASPSGYKNVTVTCAASSAASPFANGDSILLDFTPTGDMGATGATGATGAGITPQAVGFTISGGTTSKTLTVALDASVSGANTGDQAEIVTPTNSSPADAATVTTETPTLTGSTFYSNYGATHSNTQVQVSTSSNFASPLYSSGDQAGSVSFALPAGQLSVNTTYYWRTRYKNSRGTYSEWSTATTFTTDTAFTAYIATPTATPAAFGDAFEGGFYTGLVWNELIQSATSTTIGTGSKTFTVSSGAAFAYSGQALEVRSRANPVNKMIGTVTSAGLTFLTINVTSVGGSGTFTDWSVMSKYRVIVAPKSSGESSSKAYKNANSAAPAACGTLTEGWLATLAMVAAGDATTYPAAHFCNDLSIGGKTDWYLPARDELELAWRNLKPTADANYTTANRSTAATPNYMNLGSYGDTANTHGLNNNSSPTGAAYISGTPAQVAAGKNFRTGESEAFAYGSYGYWSASEYSTTDAWDQHWHSGAPGFQANLDKTGAYYVRAVRRSII